MNRFPDAGWRPTRSQELLLRAALLEGEPGLSAWREWRERERLERLDAASNRLVGLLWRNLEAQGVRHPSMDKLKGVYRHTWFSNQTNLRQVAVPLAALREAGIPTLVLKGGSLCALYYRDWGVRGLEDLDVLVPPERAAEAMRVLEGLGAEPYFQRPEEALDIRHSLAFEHPGGWHVDLHWYSLWRSSSDAGMWSHSVPLELHGEPTRAPGPTHQLLHVCAHGADYSELAPIRWVADAAIVIRNSEVDWELLGREAEERLLTVLLRSSLEYLHDTVDAAVPEEILRRLGDAPSPRFERAGFEATSRPFRPVRQLRMLWERYRRMSRLKPPGPRAGLVRTYYGFFAQLWDVERPWQFPGAIMRYLLGRRSEAG